MDIELNANGLFQPTPPEYQTVLFSKHSSMESYFSFDLADNPNILLRLIDNSIVLSFTDNESYFLDLAFDVKFEVIYASDKNVTSPKLGVRLYDEKHRETKLYSDKRSVEELTWKLSKKINQKGFHEMFKPIKKLGKGNFATVYEAERVTDQQRFAVKAFSKQNSYSAKNGRESLINELNILRELNQQPHPNVLKLEAVFESENSIYVVLQLLTGQTLFHVIQQRKGHFSKEETKKLIRGLLSGLDHIHSHRIMHRDLKPENIMLRGDSLDPVIVDFGLSTNADLKEYLFFRCGTPGYVAPEIIQLIQCSHVEPVCDIFSLGAIFHIMLVKKPLFEGTKYDEVYKNNKEFRFKIDGDGYKYAEPAAVDLLRDMLHLIPEKRICSKRALDHGYIKAAETDMEIEAKVGSPTLTEVSGEGEKKKKKSFFIF